MIGMNVKAGKTTPFKDCSLVVMEGATGREVLQQAVAEGCIDSYEIASSTSPASWYESERLVCLDELCDDDVPTFFWWTWPMDMDSPWAEEGLTFEAYYSTYPCVLWLHCI